MLSQHDVRALYVPTANEHSVDQICAIGNGIVDLTDLEETTDTGILTFKLKHLLLSWAESEVHLVDLRTMLVLSL